MWTYEERLQFPVEVTQTCLRTTSLIISQFSGPGSELAASMRYPSQRYTMPCKEVGGLLTGIGTEELVRLEVICVIIYQPAKNLTPEQAKTAGLDAYYIDHTTAPWPAAAAGTPFNTYEFQSKSDAMADLHEDLAVEQKTRTTYNNLIRIIENPEAREPLRFLRAKEVVHFQRFGEALEKIEPKLDEKNFYYFSLKFDKQFVQNEK